MTTFEQDAAAMVELADLRVEVKKLRGLLPRVIALLAENNAVLETLADGQSLRSVENLMSDNRVLSMLLKDMQQ